MSQPVIARNQRAPEEPAAGTPAAEVRRIRMMLGVTQSELADYLQYSAREVIRWESGAVPPPPMVLEALRRLEAPPADPARAGQADFTFIDLFAGIGGIRRGFEAAGGRCVFTSEWDRFCRRTYYENFGREHLIRGDITNIPPDAIPKHDVLLAGFPCQPFSLAGVSKKNSLGRPHGFDCNTQGTLFFYIEQILAHHRPRAFLLENVKNLLSHDRGKTWKVIHEVLRQRLGYHIHPEVIDARRVLPQHRERIFIVGFDKNYPFDWRQLALPGENQGPKLDRVLHPEDGSEEPEEPFTDRRGRVDRKYVLSDHLWGYLQEYAKKHRERGNGFGYSLFGSDDVARTLSARYHKDGSEILIRRRRGNPRRLTPRECARLMGFDPLLGAERSEGERFRIPVSDTQAYRQFGNSVAVPVVEAVAKLMKPFIIGAVPPNSEAPGIVPEPESQLDLQIA